MSCKTISHLIDAEVLLVALYPGSVKSRRPKRSGRGAVNFTEYLFAVQNTTYAHPRGAVLEVRADRTILTRPFAPILIKRIHIRKVL